MNTGYQIYRTERPLSRAEQHQVDIAHAELARAVSRCWHALAAPLRALRRTGRQPGYRVTEYPAAERLPEGQTAQCQTAECLPGRAA
jgi:hypothetical protein